MAKVNRSTLKKIVKECLVEILAEGITNGNVEELNENFSSKRGLNEILNTEKPKKTKNENFERNTRNVISKVTNDPIMSSLLEDTANSTLQEQNSADSSNRFAGKPTDSYSRAVDNADPIELFGNASSNWANLAFSDNKK